MVDIGEGMTAIRIRFVLGVLGAGGAGVLFLTTSDVDSIFPGLAAIVLFAIAAGLLLDGVGRYRRLKPFERRPIVGPRLSAAMLIILGALLAICSVLKLWEIAV
jgi:hypothetical protein